MRGNPEKDGAPVTNILFTSYNAERGQTDGSPCHAAVGHDVCHFARQGMRIIALSQDLVGTAKHKKRFTYEDKVWLESLDFPNDPRCNGEFVVLDTMNARFRHRGDLFQLNRKDNVSCRANVYKVISF